MQDRPRNISILGSTGSIGTQALDIAAAFPERFRVRTLTAGRNRELLARQAARFLPDKVIIADRDAYPLLKKDLEGLPVKVECGADAIADAMEDEQTDTVLAAMVGYSGLAPALRAASLGKRIALANKETLVAAGELVMRTASEGGAEIIPVDSEHSAIFQCLRGEKSSEAEKIILTASGGPFRTLSASELENVTVEDALRHPNWSMGAKVTIDSASMMNKGFEMIEARWLFGCPPEKIEVVVHPQSIVHSMVQFADGSVKAQLGIPDMHTPIQYALSFPDRLPSPERAMRLADYASLTFESPDMDKFPLLRMAYEAIEAGGNRACALNAANEIAVKAFLAGKIRFTGMPRLAERVLAKASFVAAPDYGDIVATDQEARALAEEEINKGL